MRRRFWKLVAWFSALLTLLALGYIGFYLYQGRQNDALYDQVMEQARPPEDGGGGRVPLLADLDALQAQNPDCIGVLRVPGTKINYPVMYSTQEEGQFYLRRNFNAERSMAGTLFLDHRCGGEVPAQHQIIYGHYMRNGQMFGQLKYYQEEDFWREHPYILYQTKEGTGVYKIFSTFRLDPAHEEGLAYLKAVRPADPVLGKRLGVWYDTGIQPGEQDPLLTLITCDYAVANGRMVVTAYRVPDEEAPNFAP